MNDERETSLIDEGELRTALQPWRPVPSEFAAGIQRRLDQPEFRIRQDHTAHQHRAIRSDWVDAAAAVIPLPLLGVKTSGSLVKLGQLTFGKKLVALAALPATGLLLMITATVWAIIKIRQAHRVHQDDSLDVQRITEVTAMWGRQFMLMILATCGLTLFLIINHYTLPLFIIFLTSGTAMVLLVTRLGQARLVDRKTIAQSLITGLLALSQLMQDTISSYSYPFLDQTLIPAVLMLGALLIAILCIVQVEQLDKFSGSIATSISVLGLIAMIAWFSNSLLMPVSTQSLKRYVESFDKAEFSSASWHRWQAPTEWLQERKVPLDLSKPRGLLEKELRQNEPNITILCSAIETGLIEVGDIERIKDLAQSKKLIFAETQRNQPFISVDDSTRFLVRALVLRNELSESEKDYLGVRLKLTMQSLRTKSYGFILAELLVITKLAQHIDRPIDIESNRAFVHETLVSHQCLKYRFGIRSGGFTSSASRLAFSSPQATEDAIELMQWYGVPREIRIEAIRSYLRPSAHDHWFGLHADACYRVAGLQRLESLPEVRPITWFDFFRYEQNLLMAILFTLVSVFATLGAPNLKRT